MGINKGQLFEHHHQQLSAWAKALSHPARIAILSHLLVCDVCMCGDIVEVLPLAQSTISQHLKELKQVGLIKGEIEGNAVCYCIDKENWQKCKNIFINFFENLQNQNAQNENTNLKSCC